MNDSIQFQEDHKGVACITLNRPQKQNAITPEMIETLLNYLKKISVSKTVRILQINASGDHFCSGADLEWMKSSLALSQKQNRKDAKQLADLYYAIYHLNIPTVAFVKGNVYGGGLGIVACCDFVYADETTSTFCFSEVKLGLAPATIAPYVIRAIGERVALRYFVSAEKFNAHTALEIGLISGLGSSDIIKQLLANSQQAMQQTKRLVRSISSIDECLYEDTIELIANLRQSEEAQVRLSRFLNKTSD